jgi:hypothetical protein
MAMAAGSSGGGGRDGEDWSNSRDWWSRTDWCKSSWDQEEEVEEEEEADDKDGWWQSGGWNWWQSGDRKAKKKREDNKGGIKTRLGRIALRDHQTVLNVCRKALGSDLSNLPLQQQILFEKGMSQQAESLASATEQARMERTAYVMSLQAHEQALLHRAQFMAAMPIPEDVPAQACNAYISMNTHAHLGPRPPMPKAGWISPQEHMPKVVNQNVRPNLFGPPPKHQPVMQETFVATPVFASPGPCIRPAGAPLGGCSGCFGPQMAAGCGCPQMAAGCCGSQMAGFPAGQPARPFGPCMNRPTNSAVAPKMHGSVATGPPAPKMHGSVAASGSNVPVPASGPKVTGATSKPYPPCPASPPPGFPVQPKTMPQGPPGAIPKTPEV